MRPSGGCSRQPIDHGMRRCLGAYRAAIASGGFIDAAPILACSALDALSATHKVREVIDRLARYASSGDTAARLQRLYLVRGAAPVRRCLPEGSRPRRRRTGSTGAARRRTGSHRGAAIEGPTRLGALTPGRPLASPP
jgi:hypothetical protein